MKLPAVSPLHAPSGACALVSIASLLAFCLACAPGPRAVPSSQLVPAPGPSAASALPAEPAPLETDRPVERSLAGGEQQEHVVTVEAGWYVQVKVEPAGIDVTASLIAPEGVTLMVAHSSAEESEQMLAALSPAAGELRVLVVANRPEAPPGSYRVTMTACRPAGPGDADRVAAQKAIAEARLRAAPGDEQAKRSALPLFEEAIRRWEAAGEPRLMAGMLNELGTVQRSLSDTRGAIASNQRALAIAEQVGDHHRQATSLNNLGVGTWAEGDHAVALLYFERSLALWKELGDLRQQGVVLYGIGSVHRDQGNFDQARRALSEALPLLRSAGDIIGEVVTQTALGGVYLSLGEIGQATACLEEALRLSRSPGGEGSETSLLQTMAQIHIYRGELGEALARLREARDFSRRSGSQGSEVRALNSLGGLYRELGDLDEAQRSFEEGLALVAGKNPDSEARMLNSRGWIRYLRGDLAGAILDYENALVLGKDNQAVRAQALGFTGVAFVALGRVEDGLKLLRQELELRRERLDRREEARSLLDIASAYQTLGDLDQAASFFGEALALGRRIGNTSLEATCLYRWAVLDRQRGDLKQALTRVQEALRIIESVRSQVTSEKLRTIYLASRRSWYELEIDLRLRLEETEPDQGHAAAALAASERARARGLLDLLAEGSIDVQEGIASDLKERERELGARLSLIQDQLGRPEVVRSPDGERAQTLRKQLDATGEELERLEEEIRHRHPQYAEVRYPTPLRLEQIRGLLDERTTLLEYFVGQEGSYLFVVTWEKLSVHRLPPAAVLEEKVRSLRMALESPGRRLLQRFRKESSDLYAILLGPAAAELERIPNLLISPDGPLYLLPFEVLPTNPDGGGSYRDIPYLLRSHAVSYVPSASVLDGLLREPSVTLADGQPAPKKLIAFGDPVSAGARVAAAAQRGPGQNPASPWTDAELPGSGREVATIAALYSSDDVELYLRENATEENVKGNPLLRSSRRIHFATHGLVDEVRPQLSGLLLTRTPGSQEDGLLQVYEIFNLQLDADLVALSACETGLGEVVTGEGMVGLTRAFLYAGARSLLVSLWPVSDLSTPDLMVGFYRHLEAAETKAEALRRTKLEQIESGAEPYRWAPFVLAGSSR